MADSFRNGSLIGSLDLFKMWIYSVMKQCCVLLRMAQQFCYVFVSNYFICEIEQNHIDHIVSKM